MSAHVGKPLDRVDGRLKITGGAKYAAEFRPRGLVHAVAVQSTIARGAIASIDTAAASKAPGVLAVLTHANAPQLKSLKEGDPSGGHAGEDLPPLSTDEIHFAGQTIALVIAEKLEQARRGAALVKIAYREEKPVLEIAEAEGSATKPARHMGRDVQHQRGDAAAGFAAGPVKIEATYTTPVETHNPMELSATIAEWQGDRLMVWDATQAVIGTRGNLAKAFGVPKSNVRVLCPYVGGGFGCKGSQWTHTFAAAMAARFVKRPVRLVVTRAQMFTSAGHRPPTVQKLALAAARDGKLTAIRHESTTPTSPVTDYIEPCGKTTSAMLYACENADIPHRLVRVNVAAPTFMRAPGECPGTFAIESAMDELAVALEMDPVELRLKNHADANPSDGRPFSSKWLKDCYAVGAERFGWKNRTPQPGSMKDGNLLVGWGMATAVYPGNRWPASAIVKLTPDGRARVRAATQDLGTGAYTIFTQVSADSLGLPVERITFELGDSDFPEAPVSGGSNSSASVSEAIIQAAAAVKAKLAGIAAADPGSPLAGLKPEELALADGRLVSAATPSRGVPIQDLVRKSGESGVEASASVKLEDEKTKKYSIHSFGAHFCEVKIDAFLPRVQVTRWVSAMDIGRVLNPKTSRSQVLGGVTMGVGMALMEHTAYDPRTGRPVTDNLADYAVPVNADIGSIEVHFMDKPDPVINSLGCRGVGEIGITGAAAAVANAVYHATGKRIRDLPITPDKLL
ncbi:MAG: xanthine dehydrogenase family protein molybdopterin-binding subunit [Acidobacteriota bacterium]